MNNYINLQRDWEDEYPATQPKENKKCPATNPCDCSEQDIDCPLLKEDKTPQLQTVYIPRDKKNPPDFAYDEESSHVIADIEKRYVFTKEELSKLIADKQNKAIDNMLILLFGNAMRKEDRDKFIDNNEIHFSSTNYPKQ